ncbi:GPW/gp25 family protein [Oceanobacter kriegii]|uniref:GPW/gp25 family protein n=1 Tax=Oceanobacter kriegii TaxID=64972 RepID=UPI0003FAD9C2|nr:GPW/gp25 family protein [Oceanobacter kriegii]
MTGMNETTGATLTEREHILQSVATLIRTPVGSRVHRRTYGSVAPHLVDQPLNTATALRLYSAVAASIMVWEPRVSLSSIQLAITAAGKAVLDLELIINDEAVSQSVSVEVA